MNTKYLVTGIVLVAVLAGGIFFLTKNRGATLPSLSGDTSGLKSKGTPGAKIKIEEFSDFQCPSCKRAQKSLNELLETYKGKIEVVFYHFPLSGHQWSAISHQAAECAREQGKFWEFHDKLFEEQANWAKSKNPTEAFLTYAKEMGIELQSFGTCLTSQEIRNKVLEDKAKGSSMQVRSTPTFLINGKERVVGSVELICRGQAFIRETLGLPPLEEKIDETKTAIANKVKAPAGT